jgi:hypothetical protein
MDKLKNFFRKPLTAGFVGAILGAAIGLAIGWGLWPVKWYDLDASTLRQDLKTQYLCMIVDSYKVNKNANLAVARLDSMGTSIQQSPTIFDYLQTSDGCSYTANDEIVSNLKTALLSITPANNNYVQQPTASSGTKKSSGVSGILLGLLCVVFLGIGAALIYIFFFRNKRSREKVPPAMSEEGFEPQMDVDDYAYTPVQPIKSASAGASAVSDNPAAHFMTTYLSGDDLYDDSFSIDSANGEFLGECGVGISDTVGVGDPKKVSAFEVWLFDKNDIQTVTKVLMSSRGMSDPSTLQRLSTKGEPVLVEPGKTIMLETASLQLQAKVVEMVYGQGAMPAGSYFDRLTLELTVWPK